MDRFRKREVVGSLLVEDFGQKVDLTRRIREVLTNYPEGTTVLKEIIQNADDAGATKVCFCLDRRTHGTQSLLCEQLKEWQGPALMAYNNSQFTEQDFVSISRIGDSQKRGQAWKTGRFGVGFNSVYHLTDLPSFVSGKYVVFFDPQGKYLPNISAANPGKRIDYVSSAALSLYKDQFSSYCTFDCDMRNSYSGTLFRFPLRNMEQAEVSKLSRQSYSEEDILALFTQLYTEAVFAMLFLKNITTLEMYVWNASAETPERMYSCYLESPNSEVVWHRQALLRLSNLNKNVGSELDTFSLDFVRKTFDATQSEQIVDSFMIVQSMASSSSKIGALANNAAKEHDLHLLPWASVAACISGKVSKDLICRDGRAFCFLPLPVRTGLPVHVNGYFELSSNRRDIWYGSDMDRGGKLRSDWNLCLLEEVVAPAFSKLLMKASKSLGPSEQYYSLWPCGPFEEPWETLVKQIYRNIQEFPSVYSKVEGGKWILPAAAFLHDEGFSKSKELVDALIFFGMPVVELPKPVVDMLFSYCATLPKMVCPATVRNMLRSLTRKSLLDRGQCFLLLEYCLDDLVDDEVGCMASGLSLIPLASGRYGVFEEGLKARPYFVCSDSEYKLLESLTDRLVDKNIPVKLHNRLSNIARASKTNITFLNSTHLAHLLSQILPTDWRYKEIVEWMPETDENHPTQTWLVLLWCYLKDYCEDISNFLDWPILPTTTGCLYRASKNSKMINGQLLTDSIKNILIKVGCQILNPDFEVEHRQLSLYVHDASAVGVLDAIFEVALRQESHLATLFENITANERRELCRYFLNPKWYSGGQMTESHVHICKHLPVFELYNDNVRSETSLFTDLEMSQKFLGPLHMDRLLLGSEFLYSSSGSEEEVLLNYYGIQRIGRASFYTRRVLNRISEISPQLLEDVMLSILYELPQLCAEDSTIREILKNLEFVPTISGRLRSPNSLYDPRNEELYDLLDDHDNFPCGKFRESGALDMLQGLELRTTVSPETVLQSARQIESLVHNDPAKAHSRGEVLLSYLELNANKWLPQSPGEANKTVNKMLTKMASAFHLQDSCSYIDLTKFWNDLTMICWCPVLVNPPYSLLPWPSVSTTVAPPKLVRLPTDVWLVSASLRILDGECRSNTLSHCLGWSSSPGGSIIAAQLLELGKNNEIVADQIFRQELALAMPRLYSLLTAMIGTDEMDIVKAILEGSRWVWVGDGFAKVDEVVLYGPFHLAPYVRVIPIDLAVFKDLFMDLGVRESLSPRDFAMVLSQMAANKKGSPLNAHELRAATLIVQYLADAKFHDKQIVCYIPDVSSILMPVTELAFNDAPWLSTSNEWVNSGSISAVALTSKKKVPKFVHGNISNDVAERLGVYSLRRLLLAESADSMNLGLYGAAEAFGQHEALTTRLKHIVEMYADGPGILFELVQNADDAGATEVCFLLDKTQYGTSSILSPQMADWQGPALYCYNNSVFTAQDLYAISRIGQDSKLEKPFAIGRFGLGFNSVYHFTDIPGFVSGENIVMFDPHASYLPGITPSHPGLRISFVGRDILEQFPDQFSPYMHFGCDLQNPFPGTLFRFPLRTSSVSACSQIKKESYRPEDVLSLFSSFYTNAGEALLFLRNVMNISVYVKDGSNQEMVLLHRVSRLPVELLDNQPSPANVMLDFIYGDCKAGMDKEKFFQKLQKTPETQLPWSCAKVIMTSSDTTEKTDLWMVSECLGGGHAKAKSLSPENRERSFIPWAGVAAKLQIKLEEEVKGEANLVDNALEGRAFCFLPLPVNTGLPVHINGYFELSSNRRDIWFGDDMAGGGKLRSDWNLCLLEDAAAPAYARLLANVAREIGPCSTYYLFWPTATTREPWASLMQKVYVSITDLDVCVLYTNARGGQWISAKQAVFPDYSFAEVIELGNALAEAGLTLINAPKSVVDRFWEFCPSLRYLTPHLLRTLLIRRKRGFKQREAMLVTLKYCLDDCDDPLISDKLHGLPLLPLATGLFTTFAKSGQGENLYVTSQNEYDLLKDAVPYLLIDRTIDAQIFSKLQRIASSGGTNLCLLTSSLLKELMPKILPVEWEGRKSVLWTPGYQGQPSFAWMSHLWAYFKSSCPDLTVFSMWPLLPARDGHLLQLVRNSNVIKDDGWSENMCSLLKKTGCFMLRSDLQIDHAGLEGYVQNATATGVLNALLASGAGIPNLKGLFTNASEGELRELRSFLCQSKWFSIGEVSSQQIDIMKALPIFESHGSRQFVSLTGSIKWLKPNEVDEELLNDSFIRTSSEIEDAILRDYLGIQRPSKKQFYREHMVNTLSMFASQPEVMMRVIRDLRLLIRDDSTVGKSISDLPFILTGQGSLQKPGRLYDPRVPELLLLLHEDAFFPSREFKAPEILDFLVEMGLKNSLGQKGLLDSARSIAMLYEAGKESEAFKMAKRLLEFINKMNVRIVSREQPRIPGHEDRIYDDKKDEIFTNPPKEESCETHNDIAHQADGLVADELEEEFWMELANTCWCPVYNDPPVQGIPWPKSIRGSLAPPKVVRQEPQMWLVSSTMRILDGECRSSNIQRRLGWLERPNVGVLAAQLIELSKTYSSARSDSDSNRREFLDAVLQREVPAIYSLMQEYVATEDFILLQSLLEGVQWVWIGDNFVSSKELAFDSPAKFQPYLYVVPSELSVFKNLLTALGVRLTFDVTDYIQVLQHLNEDMKGKALSSEQLSFVLRVLEAVADTLGENLAFDSFQGSILVPDASGILRSVRDLVYNDAPWLVRTNIDVQNYVHSSISNDLAERLGVKSLRNISFMDQEMTKDLPCMDHIRISEVLKRYGNYDLLLFDLLEIADRCKARKVHFVYDKRDHPRQSLLQPNLGEFQGPSLTVVLEGAVLSMEEICILQLHPPWNLRGQAVNYGSGLLSCYQLCDVSFIVSGGFLYLFDPFGLVLCASLNRGDSLPSELASARMYSLQGTDLPERFQDQFRPLSFGETLSCASSDSTIIRMPLKSKFADENVENGPQRIKHIFEKFKAHASSALLFLKSVEQVWLSSCEGGQTCLSRDYAVSVDPSASTLRSPFPEKKWRKFQLSNLFSSSSVATKFYTIDVHIIENGSEIVDRWFVALTLGSGQTRNMALDRRFMSYNLAPIAGVAANISRNGKALGFCLSSCILSPLPTTCIIDLPVTILGCFLLYHNDGRFLFENQASRNTVGNRHDTKSPPISSWNMELMACARDSYVELVLEFQRLKKDPLTSHLEISIAQGVSGVLQSSADRAYLFWPRSKPKISSSTQMQTDEACINSLTAPHLEWECIVQKVIRPFYSRLVELPVWQLYGGAVVKAEEGMFLATPGFEIADHSPPVTVCSFIKEHYPVFAVPWEFVREIEAVGISVKEITPKMVRDLLKASPTSIVLRSVETYIDILEYCFSDLRLQQQSISGSINPSPGNHNVSFQDNANHVNLRSIANTTRSGEFYDPAINIATGQNYLRNSRTNFQRVQNPSAGSSLDAGGDPLEIMTNFGRALLDFGRGVVEDFSKVGGPSTQADGVTPSGYGNITSQDTFIVGEIKGLPCPTATKYLSRIGLTELWIGNKEQQMVMLPLAVKFIHLQCFDRPSLRELFENRTVQRLLRLQPFSSQLLSAHLKSVLSKQWVTYVNDMGDAPWVSWDYVPDSLIKGPSTDWLRLFWKNIGSSVDELRLFSDWPLIPAIASTPVLCRVRQHHLVFIPPEVECPTVDTSSSRIVEHAEVDNSSFRDYGALVNSCIKSFEVVESKHSWLLPLLNRCNVPVYDKCFLDCNALQCCQPRPGQTLGQVVISKLLAAKQAGFFSSEAVSFSSSDCDSLFSLFASDFSPSPSLIPTYSTEELDMLRSLAIYRTVVGTYTSLNRHDACIVSPGAFFQPVDERCLCYFSATSGGLFYRVLGVSELQNQELLVKFGLPAFEQKIERDQECILIYLYLNWGDLQMENTVIAALKETRFVKSGANQVNSDLLRPRELLDPDDSLLKSVFAGDSSKFPGGRFATDGWLCILRKVGLRTASEPEMLLECARKVEMLAKESTLDIEISDFFVAGDSLVRDELPTEIWSLAGTVVETILKHFVVVYGSSFCSPLSQIAFVPAEKGMPSIGGRKGGKRVLTSYSEAILLRDWPLAWTCAPILARQNFIPPEFSWGALHLRSPPPFLTVLKHLQIVGKNGGEEMLARWPTAAGMKSVEDAFNDVLKYLCNIWGTLSSSDILELKKVPFIPIANGTRLVTASSLFVRLGVNLAPLAFELPSLYLPYVGILRDIGLQEAPTFASARVLLVNIQQESGYQHLNPNEIRAVLNLLQFICEEGKRSKVDGSDLLFPDHDAVVPDEGCRLVHARVCVYVDAHGSCLLGEIDTSRLRFVNPQLSEDLCMQLGVKKLSDVVVEELDQQQPLATLEAFGSLSLKTVTTKILSPSFHTAVWMVIHNFKEHIPSLRHLTQDEVKKVLVSASEKLCFVHSIYTCFVMLPSSVDITLNVSSNIKQSLFGEKGDGLGHRVLQFVDRSKHVILVAEPPDVVAVSDILAAVVSRLLDSPMCLPISALFNVPIGSEVRALDLLRLASHSRNGGNFRSSVHQGGQPGQELIPADAMQVQFHPLRPFYAGEIIAWRSDSEGGVKLKYGKVPENVRPSAGQAMYRLLVEMAPGEFDQLLSSNVLSFKSMVAGSSSRAVENNEAGFRSGSQHVQNIQEPRKPNTPIIKFTQNQEKHAHIARRVSSSEIVHAVSDMLAAAGIPMGLEKQLLLQQTLNLKEELTSSQTALVVEQERADSAVKEAETAKTAWSCRVCLNSEVDTMLTPCGHVLCQRCCSAVVRCPFCRHQVSKALRMYRP